MIKIAFQGVQGAFSEMAARQFFGGTAAPCGYPEFADVFRAVVNKRAAYGIIPIENSLTGSIHQNFDLLLQRRVWICGEVKLRVSHSLIAHPKARLRELKRVYSHPQALWQCKGFLRRLSRVEQIPYFDTAGSVKLLREQGQRDSAAVAAEAAARRYGMKVLKRAIEDNKHNYTRFLVLSPRPRSLPPERRGRRPCKTSVVFALRNVPGALHQSLGAFALRGIQLLKVESRPIIGSPWEYQFYLDFDGSATDRAAAEALRALRQSARGIKVLGSYYSAR